MIFFLLIAGSRGAEDWSLPFEEEATRGAG
jgi:hypothetical protein